MVFRVLLACLVVFLNLGLTSAKADKIADDVLAILQLKENAEEKFHEGMRQGQGFERIMNDIKTLENTYGSFMAVRNVDGVYLADTEKFDAVVNGNFMPDGTFSGFSVYDFRYKSENIQQTLEYIKSEGKISSIHITKGNEIVFSENADEQLAISDTQRLGIMAALRDAVGAGTITPKQTMTLEERLRSFPPSRIDTFENGMTFDPTILTRDMMRLNGATATDMLIDLIGREAIAEKLGTDLILMRREQIGLRNYEHLRESFEKANPDGKLAIAKSTRELPPSLKSGIPDDYASLNVALSAKEICNLLDEVKTMSAISGNLGAASGDDWKEVASVSGASSYVVNLSSILTSYNDNEYCVVTTLNDVKENFSANRVIAAYKTLLDQLLDEEE